MRVVGKGKDLTVKLLDANSGQLFAQCSVPNGDHESYIERVTDSSRYFVLKITNGARHAFIGLGFEERNDAFDFTASLSDFKSTFVDRESEVAAAPKIEGPAKDLSLKEGQKITVNLKGLVPGSTKRQNQASNASGGFAGLAPPPPAGGQSRRQPAAAGGYAPQPLLPPAPAAAPAPAPAATSGDDPFGDFGDFADFQSAAAPAPAAAPTPAPAPTAPVQNMGGLASAFDGLNLGGAPTSMPSKPAPAAAPTTGLGDLNFDPFAAFSAAPAAAPAAAPQTSPLGGFNLAPGSDSRPAPKPSDQFDEFDIFK